MDIKPPLGRDIHMTSCAIDSYISTHITGVKETNLTGIEGLTLGFLAHDESPKTMRDVMNHFHIAKATASQTLTSLEKKGVIVQKVDEDDKRKKMILITEEGKRIQNTIDQKFLIMNSILEEGITEEEKEQFHSILLKIRCNLGRDY